MKQLKIKMWNIENIVLMAVLDQDESLRGKRFVYKSEKTQIHIIGGLRPKLFEDSIYIQGTHKEHNDRISSLEFDTIEQAKEYINRVKEAVTEYNESIKEILNVQEKEYLKAVIKPFRGKVKCIVKNPINKEKEYIAISLKNDFLFLPNFRVGSMYKGMKQNKRYTIEELKL